MAFTLDRTLSNSTSGAAGGDLGSSYPNPIVTSVSHITTGTLTMANGGVPTSAYTDGQLLIGDSSTGFLTKATITAGTNISITNGHGSITITYTGP